MRPSTPYTINTKGHTVYQCGQPSSTMLHEPHLEHAEHSSFSATGMEFGCVVNTRQPVTLASQDSLAQLCDSIRQAPAPSAKFFLPQYEARMLLSLLWAETTVLPAKYAVEPVPPAEMKTGCIPVQGPFLRVVPVTSQLYQSCRGCPCPIEGSRHSHPQLSRRLAIFNSLLRGTWSSST